jgi:hypothetical protein
MRSDAIVVSNARPMRALWAPLAGFWTRVADADAKRHRDKAVSLTVTVRAAMEGEPVACSPGDALTMLQGLRAARDLLPNDDLGSNPAYRENLTTAINELDYQTKRG